MTRRRLTRDEVLQQRQRGAEFADLRCRALERRRVEFLLNTLKLGGLKKRMLWESRLRTGVSLLTLDLFNEMVPRFPLLLGQAPADRLTRLHLNSHATLPALFNRFEKSPFVGAYDEFYEANRQRAGGRGVALLCARRGIPQGLVVHEGAGLADCWVPGMVAVYRGGTREAPRCLHLQAWAPLVRALAEQPGGWWPEAIY